MKQFFHNGFFTYFERLSFHDQNEKDKGYSFLPNCIQSTLVISPINPKIVTGLLVVKIKNRIFVIEMNMFLNEDSWSLTIQEITLDFDDKLEKLILEGHTLPCLYSDGFCKPTLKYPSTIVRFPEEIC